LGKIQIFDISSFSHKGTIQIGENADGESSQLYARQGSIFIRAGQFVIDHSNILADVPFSFEEQSTSVFDIQADTVKIQNGSLLSTDTLAIINGAPLSIRASEDIDISASQIRVGSIGAMASGHAGTLRLSGKSVTLRDESQIQSESKDGSAGNAGNIIIRVADAVTVSDSILDVYSTGLGMAGNVEIKTNTFSVLKGGHIHAYTEGQGIGGDINLKVMTLWLDDEATMSSESRATSFGGEAGTIAITAKDIRLTNHSAITTEAISAGGGAIDIQANNLVYLIDSKITTSVQGGTGT
jgi:hypothetical protein